MCEDEYFEDVGGSLTESAIGGSKSKDLGGKGEEKKGIFM